MILLRNEGILWMDHVKTRNQMSQTEIRLWSWWESRLLVFMNAIRPTTSFGQRSVRKSGFPPAQIHQMLRQKSISSFVKEIQKKCWSVGELGVSWETSLGCLTVSQPVQWDTTVTQGVVWTPFRKVHVCLVYFLRGQKYKFINICWSSWFYFKLRCRTSCVTLGNFSRWYQIQII